MRHWFFGDGIRADQRRWSCGQEKLADALRAHVGTWVSLNRNAPIVIGYYRKAVHTSTELDRRAVGYRLIVFPKCLLSIDYLRTLSDLQWRGRTVNGRSTSTARNGSSFTQVEINVECLSVQFHIVLLL
jgi:hypothetical protein